MSQAGIDMLRVQQLRDRLRQNEEESRALKAELNRAQSSVSAAAGAALDFDPVPSSDYHVSPSRSLLKDSDHSRTGMVPRTAAAVLGLKTEHAQMVRLPTRWSTCSRPPLTRVSGPSSSHEAVEDEPLGRAVYDPADAAVQFDRFGWLVGKVKSPV